jgi:hypothetical protein
LKNSCKQKRTREKLPFRRRGTPPVIRFEKFSLQDDRSQPALGPFLSLDPTELEREAQDRSRSGGSESALEIRGQAQLLRRLNTDERTRTLLLWEFEDEDWETFQLVHSLAQKDPKALDVLFGKTLKYCEALARLSAADNEDAARRLARIALLATQAIEKVAAKKPEVLREVARNGIAWPVLKSRSKRFSTGHKNLLKRLEVGRGCITLISANPFFIPKNRLGYVSWKLWHYINFTRNRMLYFRQHRPEDLQLMESKSPGGLSLEKEAANLPDISADMAPAKWLKLGKKFLVEAYPHPRFAGVLDHNIISLLGLITAKAHTRSPAALFDRFFYEIERNFELFGTRIT